MSAPKVSPELVEVAERCQKIALVKGASEAAARAYKVRDVNVQWRDGKLEQIGEATTRGVSLQLYVDGRYSAVGSSDLRPEALETFIADAVVMTRSLTADLSARWPTRSCTPASLPSTFGSRTPPTSG